MCAAMRGADGRVMDKLQNQINRYDQNAQKAHIKKIKCMQQNAKCHSYAGTKSNGRFKDVAKTLVNDKKSIKNVIE